MSILAACAFALAGDRERAEETVLEHGILQSVLTHAELTAIALSSPRDVHQVLLALKTVSQGVRAETDPALLRGEPDPLESTIRRIIQAQQDEDTGVRNRLLGQLIQETHIEWGRYIPRLMINSPCGSDGG